MKKLILVIVTILVYTFICLFIVALIVSMLQFGFTTNKILGTIDSYIKLILGSWPACILIIGILLLTLQKDAIDEFIRKRMTSVGPNGINAIIPIATDASEKEIKAKAVEDAAQTVDILVKKVPKKEKGNNFTIEENVQKAFPNTKNPDFITKLEKARSIEENVQIYLLAKFGSEYKPNIKLSKEGQKPLIIDGLITSKKNKSTAVEIRYIGSSSKSDALKYIIIRLRDKLRLFGIKRLLLIIVADNIQIEDAVKIREQLNGLVIVNFYNYRNNVLEELELPDTIEKEE